MAEIAAKGGKKGTPRVDLTPMVDLNLLLITFFMFATTLNKPKAMLINMPFDDVKIEQQNKVKEGATMTILLGKNHRLYYYHGIGSEENPPEVQVAYFKDEGGIRDILIEKKKTVDGLIRNGTLLSYDKATVIIKPDETSTLEDFIGILDEMTINAIPVYAVVNITPEDKMYIDRIETANNE